MSIKLTHIGELLVAEMFLSIARKPQNFNQIKCEFTGRSLAQDIADFNLGEALEFKTEEAKIIVEEGTQKHACDGAQKLDIVCTGKGLNAIAFEAKLGTHRMKRSEFSERFCQTCSKSTHKNPSIKGSMIAVLERNMPFESEVTLVGNIGEKKYTIIRPWWLVLRQSIIDNWMNSKSIPSLQVDGLNGKCVRILSFDSLAQIYGTKEDFNAMVTNLVGANFADRWGLKLS